MTKYKCAGCQLELAENEFHESRAVDRNRTVTSRCKACRREDYYKSRYKTVCASCMKHRPVESSNLVCRGCNEKMGLRQCKECNLLLPLFFQFYGRTKVCKGCCTKRA